MTHKTATAIQAETEEWLKTNDTTIEWVLANRPNPWDPAGHSWNVTITKGDDECFTVPYHTGSGIQGEPDESSILNCLTLDAYAGQETLSDFLADFGYLDRDNVEAGIAAHEACALIYDDMESMFGAPGLAEIAEIVSEL